MSAHPALSVLLIIAGASFVFMMWSGIGGVRMLLLAIAIGTFIIMLNGAKLLPYAENPCPNAEISLQIGGRCYGMDTDANVRWLEETLDLPSN